MKDELQLTKANRLKVARAFRFNKRVDLSIECAIEGQLGKVIVDDLAQPTAYCIRVGPFVYYAGDALNPGGRQLMERLPAFHLLMPSPDPWTALAQEIFGDDLKPFPRHSFTSADLSMDDLTKILAGSSFCDCVIPLTLDLVSQAAEQPDSFLDVSDFDSPADFIERSFGFTILDDEGKMTGVAYGSLVCSQGIEVSIFVEEPYRQQGVATASYGAEHNSRAYTFSWKPGQVPQTTNQALAQSCANLNPGNANAHTRAAVLQQLDIVTRRFAHEKLPAVPATAPPNHTPYVLYNHLVINDHIGVFAESPLRGLNLDAFGPRFPDQSRIYDPVWLDLARRCAADLAMKVHEGVYAWCRGPQYETPAEIRLLAKLGAAAVGMSTVPEAITAAHGGMKVLALSCITNMAAGILDEPLSHEDVMAVGNRAAAGTIRLLSAILRKTPED